MRRVITKRATSRRLRPAIEPLEGKALLSSAAFSVTQDWGTGFTGQVVVKNTNATPVTNWTLEFDFAPSINPIWNAVVASHTGTHYVIAGASWDRDIPAGGSVSFGFNASPGNNPPPPTNWKLNGVPLGGSTPTLPGLSVADVSLPEGNAGTSNALFTVSLSAAYTQPVTVQYATSNGTATAGSDYIATSGTLSFAPGQTTQTVAVPVNGDTTYEPDETFNLTLTGPANATLARAVATGTIKNDDPAPPPPTNTGSVQYAVTGDWTSGFQAQVTIKNAGTSALSGWTVDFELPATISSIWDGALVSHSGTHYKVKSAGWNDSIAFGGTASFGFTASPGGAASVATNLALNSASSQPATPLPPGIVWPAETFAPFVDMTLYPMYDLGAATRNEGLKFYTLAFITADPSNNPAWGGYAAYDVGNGGDFDNQLRAQITSVRNQGGDVMASFGGAAGQELAQVITDVNALKAAYKKVVDAYSLTNIDFDIEGAAVADHVSIDRRSQALAALQHDYAAAGKTLAVHLTLPVLPTGLTADGLYVVQSALRYGVTLAGVNVMAMDYGNSAAPSPAGHMGDYAIQAATSTFNQLKSLYGTSKSDAQVWAIVGVTPMIGMNDVQTEIFNQIDARTLLTFAQQKRIGLIAFWSLNRDRENPNGAINYVETTSSSIVQQPYEFSLIFKPFTSG